MSIAKTASMRYIMDEITLVLVQTQFKHLMPLPAEPTAEEVNNREQEAIDYYLGKTYGNKAKIDYEQTKFRVLIDYQRALIVKILLGN